MHHILHDLSEVSEGEGGVCVWGEEGSEMHIIL